MNDLIRNRGSAFWATALAAALLFLAIDSVVRVSSIRNVTSFTVTQPRQPLREIASPTGYTARQHDLILPALGTDGYHWIMQTERMLAGDGLRIRHSPLDNPPTGRAVHWSGSERWWLAATAALYRLTHRDLTLPQSIERVAPWVNPLALALFMLIFTPLLARRFGPYAAALFALGCVAAYPFYDYAVAGFIDHHHLAAMSVCALLVFLVAGGSGWVQADYGSRATQRTHDSMVWEWLPEPPAARRWFIASGIAGGIGLWISAATIVPALIGIGIGALVSTTLLPRTLRESSPWRVEPSLWRVWGIAGCLTSLTFYVLEYAPAHFGMRLEVNHPLYALAWLGAGDLLYRIGRREPVAAQWQSLLLDIVLVTALPVIILLTSSTTFHVADPFLWALHEDYILEFKSFAGQLKLRDPWFVVQNLGVVLLPLLPLSALVTSRLPRPMSAALVLVSMPALLLLALAFWQIRWLGIAIALSLAGLVTVAGVYTAVGPAFHWSIMRKGIAAFSLAMILLPFLVFTALLPWRYGYPAAMDIPQVLTRDVAHMLRERVGDRPAVMVSGPTTTTWLMYFGGFQGLGTLYWENLEGLKHTAAIYNAPNADAAKALIDTHGVTHLVIFSWESFVREYPRLARGQRLDPHNPDDAPRDAFIVQLLEAGTVPAWLTPIPYAVPDIRVLPNARVWIFEVN